MTINSSLFRMADRMVGGDLVEKIRAYRQEGEGYEGIARRLFAEYRIDITGQTLRMWSRELGIDDSGQAAS